MKTFRLGAALLVAASLSGAARADGFTSGGDKVTVAVFGDWPYSQALLNNSQLLVDSVNADAEVSSVIHVGDIHSGSMPCTSAAILPPLATSNPGWNQAVFGVFQKFKASTVYTPGDNEWTDCHKSKEFASGDPLKELDSVRGLFFSRPGWTLGLAPRKVYSQSVYYNRAFPADAKFVENVAWDEGSVAFMTLNLPGSNNDGLPWTGAFANPAAQSQERAERTAADIRWLQAVFDTIRGRYKAVVIALQADMWDPAAAATGGDGLDQYTGFVQELARQALRFGGPVLVLNGDSHLYMSDKPLADPSSPTGLIHKTPAVPNLTRIVVQGSTNAPAEWLRLTIDPSAQNPFSWRNVSYCPAPTSPTCQ